MAGDLSITIGRTDLIDTLKTKRTDLEAEYAAAIQKIDDEIAAIPKAAEALKDWHIAIAKLLADGDARMTAKGEVVSTTDDEIPNKPSQYSQSDTKRNLKYSRDNLESARDSALAGIDASVRLLELATNNEVEIPVSQYERLLSGHVDARRFRF